MSTAYKDICATVVGEELPCQREDGNRAHPFAVAVVRGETIVGHIPKEKPSLCSLYLRRCGSIACQIIESGRFSGDLVQWRLKFCVC